MGAISDSTGFADSTVTLAERLLEFGIEDALMMDGFNDCVVGILERCGMESIVIYDREKVVAKLIDNEGWSYDEALEFYEFNQLGGWHGTKTPGFIVWLPEL
jgi:hypothetical protein|tara:strand:+ start:1471 stop:1776 length:306 start_codon:yes stop_codon:yes gene_type:complete